MIEILNYERHVVEREYIVQEIQQTHYSMKKGSPIKISQAKCYGNISDAFIHFAWDIWENFTEEVTNKFILIHQYEFTKKEFTQGYPKTALLAQRLLKTKQQWQINPFGLFRETVTQVSWHTVMGNLLLLVCYHSLDTFSSYSLLKS